VWTTVGQKSTEGQPSGQEQLDLDAATATAKNDDEPMLPLTDKASA
jgi:hypothetical protein